MTEQEFRCGNCGAAVDATAFAVVVVCSYCGWASVVEEGLSTVVPEDLGFLRSRLESFVRDKAGETTSVREAKFLMIPFWAVELDAVTTYNGYRTETRSKTTRVGNASRTTTYTLYVPVKGRFEEKILTVVYGRKFETVFGLGTIKTAVLQKQGQAVKLQPSLTKGWEVLGSEMSREEAVEAAENRVAEEHRKRVEKMTTKVFDCYTETRPVSARLLLYPVVEARYESRGKSYRLCMDAAKESAKVLKAELPITMGARLLRAVATAAVVLGLAVAAVVLQPLIGTDLPSELQLAIVAAPPITAALAGVAGSIAATAVQKITKTVEESDLMVMR
ncbi:MAG: hypothetical protein RMI43_02450 [Candidatus Caldarchaeum sp.]|nr:hypothetical protein [Candidatus Caldarchaeum sp.]